jgi:hypothetical protein
MDSPRMTYTSRPDATLEAEVNVLANVYRFILDCHAKKKAVEPAPEPDSCITTQIDRGALAVQPQKMRPSPV